jgi:alkaline phosphatase
MKNLLKPILLAFILLGLLLVGIFYVFNFKLIKGSTTKIEYSPGKESEQIVPDSLTEKPRNIIFFIADGMGFSHLSLALMSQQSDSNSSVWNEFEVKGWHDTRCTYGPLTDSGASATAMATGTSTYFEVIGMDEDGNSLENLFEKASKNNYATGIVTDSYIWDATPAAFVAHTKSRDNSRDILEQIAASDLDILFGELEDVGEDDNPDYDETMEILNRRFQILDEVLTLPGEDSNSKPIAAIYSEDEIQDPDSSPNLTELTEVALDYFASGNQPFVLLVECEELDSASHRNATNRMLKGLKSIQSTLTLIQDFAEKNRETLVVFTSDHETGGLAVGTGSKGYPDMEVIWATKDHTASVVPLFAHGPGAEHFANVHRNWEVGKLLKLLVPSE